MLKYPCLHLFKVIGLNDAELVPGVRAVFERVLGVAPEGLGITQNESSGGKYQTLNVRVSCPSRSHIERLYTNLDALSAVRMVL